MSASHPSPDIVVIGGGIVGSAIAYGLARRRAGRILVLDEGDQAIRAARANFGLVWVQGKGATMPAYAAWTRRSANLWARFAAGLEAEAGRAVHLRQPGGLVFCHGEAELADHAARIARMHNQTGADDTRMLSRAEVAALFPAMTLGASVTGASFCAADGDVNPLDLLLGLRVAAARRGVSFVADHRVEGIRAEAGGFELQTAKEIVRCGKIVIAAGIATQKLAAMVGITLPLMPERGQIVVTERLPAFMGYPASGLRQTNEGMVMIGATHDAPDETLPVSTASGAGLAASAIRVFPALAGAKIVRQWSGLRVLTPDKYPAYARSEQHPGAVAVACHSGVTLAAVHAHDLAGAILGDGNAPFEAFDPKRFAGMEGPHVPDDD